MVARVSTSSYSIFDQVHASRKIVSEEERIPDFVSISYLFLNVLGNLRNKIEDSNQTGLAKGIEVLPIAVVSTCLISVVATAEMVARVFIALTALIALPLAFMVCSDKGFDNALEFFAGGPIVAQAVIGTALLSGAYMLCSKEFYSAFDHVRGVARSVHTQ